MTTRTRFAPSPTGELHLGNARIAVLNWLYARHHGGHFVLRIEDTDVQRNVAGAEAELMAVLRRLGLSWDEGPDVGGERGPYRQSERLGIYERYASRLVAEGRAFRCYCETGGREDAGGDARGEAAPDCRCRDLTREEEDRMLGEGRVPAVRFSVPSGRVVVHDRVRGTIEFAAEEFEDFVILKSNGTPTYNFAVVVDDAGMGISHVIRGVGHLSNTPRQVMLYRALGEEPPDFVHVPHVLTPDGSPLSKRHGARSLREYLDLGYHPDALINYLSLLSWSSPSGEEVLTKEELIEEIDLSRIGASDVRLDPDKLEWLSGEHIRRMTAAELGERLAEQLGERFPPRDPAERERVAAAIQERITTFSAAEDYLHQLYPPDPMRWDEVALEILRREGVGDVLAAVRMALDPLPEWDGDSAMARVRAIGKEVGLRGRDLFMPVRAAVTGTTQGPELAEVFAIQGKETTLRTLDEALAFLRSGGARR
jgi:nondiscriminating glutamyl-tRNA synthetase